MELQVSFPGKMRADVSCKGFTIKTDQSAKDGGEGSAPTPFELFLASIASCAGVYALKFCNGRGIQTEGMAIRMRTEQSEGTIMKITIDIKPPDGFPAGYLQALRRSVELCAVKRHIQTPPEFVVIAG